MIIRSPAPLIQFMKQFCLHLIIRKLFKKKEKILKKST